MRKTSVLWRNAVSQTGTVDQRQQRRDASTILLTRLHFLAIDQRPIIGRLSPAKFWPLITRL